MVRITSGSTLALPDVEAFIEMLGTLDRHAAAEARDFLDPTGDVYVTRAPGRLDVMGGIADYSGSLVLEMPTAEGTLVALQPDADRRVRVVSLGAETAHRTTACEMSLDELMRGDEPISYDEARAYFQRDPMQHWASYVVGTLVVLMRERHVRFDHGVRILIQSDVPEGKSVSSSAALICAWARAS